MNFAKRCLPVVLGFAMAFHADLADAKRYLLVWSGDQVLDDGIYGQPDFLAVVDATPGSPTYGSVVNTALMPAIFGQHLLAETENVVDSLARALDPRVIARSGDALDSGLGIPSSTLNEAHHMNVDVYVDPANGHRYVYLGGLISSNIFACDVTDPLHIKPVPGTMTSQADPMTWSGKPPTDNICGLAVGSPKLRRTSAVDDMKLLPNGNLVSSQMGYKGFINEPTSWPLGAHTIAKASGVLRDPVRFPQATLTPTLQTPGGILEFDKIGKVLGEYPAAVPAGAVYPSGQFVGQRVAPLRYRARQYLGESSLIDTGPEAHPHGIGLRTDLNSRSPYWGYYHAGGMSASDASKTAGKGILIASDYVDPLSLARSQDMDTYADQGTTVRFYHLNHLQDGPYAVVQMPDGPRVESIEQQQTPEGLMAMAETHLSQHTGMFVTSMGGGALYYSPDITAPRPHFKLVYDFGPGTGPSLFAVSADDRYLILPKASMVSPGMRDANGPLYNRDYASEHDREIMVLDISMLTLGNHEPLCDAAPSALFANTGSPQPGSGKRTTTGPSRLAPVRLDTFVLQKQASKYWPNNGALDCPFPVSDVKFNTPENLATMSGPHLVVTDKTQGYVATSQYFVDLRRYSIPGVWSLSGIAPFDPFSGKGNTLGFKGDFLPGSGSVGDNTVCMMRFNRLTGALSLDTAFRDATTNGSTMKPGCISWERNNWPHGNTGHASPHAMTFVEDAR
jgi:hypothetical protein